MFCFVVCEYGDGSFTFGVHFWFHVVHNAGIQRRGVAHVRSGCSMTTPLPITSLSYVIGRRLWHASRLYKKSHLRAMNVPAKRR
jgi:hypothetical protein